MDVSDGDTAWAFALRSQNHLLILRDLLGHASVATTEVYLHLSTRPAVYRHRTRSRWQHLMAGSLFAELPLGMDLDFPGYEHRHYDFSKLARQAQVRDLARAMFERTNTGGPIKAPSTADVYKSSIDQVDRWFDARGLDESVAELTEELVFDYWRQCNAPASHPDGQRPGGHQDWRK
jgi:hypothetical protein